MIGIARASELEVFYNPHLTPWFQLTGAHPVGTDVLPPDVDRVALDLVGTKKWYWLYSVSDRKP